MNVEAVKTFCLSLPCVVENAQGDPANILSYRIKDKKFAYFKTSEPERWRFSFRVSPDRFLELTDQPGIKPARYMHRFHWVSVVQVNTMDEGYLQELILWSYQKAISSLSKKRQEDIRRDSKV